MEQRKPLRLPQYDYSQNGAYFVTVCTEGRKNLFWNNEPADHAPAVGAAYGRPPLSALGQLVDAEINRISGIYPNISIAKYTVMPNHIHMIILINNGLIGRPNQEAAKGVLFAKEKTPSLSRIIQQFKGSVSKKASFSLWQRSFHDHILRTEDEYAEVWQYIDANPLQWETDTYFGG
jgi:REP element-mobilizing transposase RayT